VTVPPAMCRSARGSAPCSYPLLPEPNLPTAPTLPPILCLGCGDGLPSHIPHRVGSAISERHDIVPDLAGASTAARPGRRAGLLALKFARHFSAAMLFRWRPGSNRHRHLNSDGMTQIGLVDPEALNKLGDNGSPR
jgi:hypothetical protein